MMPGIWDHHLHHTMMMGRAPSHRSSGISGQVHTGSPPSMKRAPSQCDDIAREGGKLVHGCLSTRCNRCGSICIMLHLFCLYKVFINIKFTRTKPFFLLPFSIYKSCLGKYKTYKYILYNCWARSPHSPAGVGWAPLWVAERGGVAAAWGKIYGEMMWELMWELM